MDTVLQNKVNELETIVNKFRHYVEKPKLTYVKAKAPYYRQNHAEQLKLVLDQMAVDRQSRLIPFKSYPDLSKHSLYNKVNQSFQFLVNEMDTAEHLYANLRADIKIKPETVGIRLLFKIAPEALVALTNVPEERKVDPIVDRIQTLIAEFIADNNQNFFLCKDINLSHKQFVEVTEFLNSYKLDKLLYNVARKSVRIVKIGKESNGCS